MEPIGPARSEVADALRKTPRWRRVVAFLATFLFPGVSQADDGEFRRGISWFLGLHASFVAGLLLMYAAIDRAWLSLGVLAAVFIAGLALEVRLAIDGYRRERTASRRGSRGRAMAIYAAFFVAAVAFAVVREQIKEHLFIAYKVSSISMEPALMRGDHMFVDRLAYARGRHPKPGDIAVFIFPEDRKKDYLKRIVAVPGDVVEIRHKTLIVNGQEIREEYAGMSDRENASIKGRDNMRRVRLPDGKYFVLGDNRDRSYDSRFFGPVDGKDLKGKAAYVYFSRDLGRIGKTIR